jgi:hypothetical protein
MSDSPIISLNIPSSDEVDPRTWAAKGDSFRLRGWVSGQLWSWDAAPGVPEGDAITVIVNECGQPESYFVIRYGERRPVVVKAPSITAALGWDGYSVRVSEVAA